MRSRGSRGDRASQPSYTRARRVDVAGREIRRHQPGLRIFHRVGAFQCRLEHAPGACDVALLQAHPAQLDTHRRGGWITRDMRLQLTSCLRDVALRAKRARFLDRGGLVAQLYVRQAEGHGA